MQQANITLAARRQLQITLAFQCSQMILGGGGRTKAQRLGDLSPSRRYWEADIVYPEWEMRDGALPVPRDRAGIGIEVDEERIDALTVREVECRRSI